MSEWECGVCGYLHKESKPPEKCPICEAPEKMFIEKQGDVSDAKVVEEKEDPVEITGTHDFRPNKQWRCTVCGYVHNGVEPPEKCPVCGADKSLFVELDVEGNAVGGEEEDVAAVAPGETVTDANKGETDVTLFSRISSLVLKLHLHPIHTHFPNGLIPVLVVFLGLAIYFDIAALETAAFFNSIAVLIVLPVVIFTGYIEWQKRYKGIKTAIFIVKIICSMLVLASVNVLVFWRIIDPNVAAEGSTTQMIYFAVALVALGAAGIAGHLGGKLVFAGRT